MLELVKFIAQSLVDQPARIVVNEVDKAELTVIELCVAPEDMGKVIGKQGRIAKAIRMVIKAASVKAKKKVTVEIM